MRYRRRGVLGSPLGSLTVSAAVLLAATACGDRERAPEPEEIAAHMQDHFSKADDLQRAVIAGDLQAAKAPARWIAEHAAMPGMPSEWIPYLPAMREAAQVAAGSTDLLTAAKATARMGAACGTCHKALGAKVRFDIDGALAEGGDAVSHMQRHVWASGRLWEGLVVPSGEVWQSGATALDEVPLVPEEVTAESQIFAQVKATANHVHELGAAARQAGDGDMRAAVYGEFLATCASCHQATATDVM
jgi:cytochrome c556